MQTRYYIFNPSIPAVEHLREKYQDDLISLRTARESVESVYHSFQAFDTLRDALIERGPAIASSSSGSFSSVEPNDLDRNLEVAFTKANPPADRSSFSCWKASRLLGEDGDECNTTRRLVRVRYSADIDKSRTAKLKLKPVQDEQGEAIMGRLKEKAKFGGEPDNLVQIVYEAYTFQDALPLPAGGYVELRFEFRGPWPPGATFSVLKTEEAEIWVQAEREVVLQVKKERRTLLHLPGDNSHVRLRVEKEQLCEYDTAPALIESLGVRLRSSGTKEYCIRLEGFAICQ